VWFVWEKTDSPASSQGGGKKRQKLNTQFLKGKTAIRWEPAQKGKINDFENRG